MNSHLTTKLLCLILVSVIIAGCAKYGVLPEPRTPPTPYTSPTPRTPPTPYTSPTPPTPQPPGSISIVLRIENWHVLNHLIRSYNSTWGLFRFAGRFEYIDSLVFKFKSSEFPDHYWLAEIPQAQSGSYEITALLFREPSTNLRLIDPPKEFSISLTIQNRKVIKHTIEDPHPGWGIFYIDKYQGGILYLKNYFYPDNKWLSRMPKTDGSWSIKAILD